MSEIKLAVVSSDDTKSIPLLNGQKVNVILGGLQLLRSARINQIFFNESWHIDLDLIDATCMELKDSGLLRAVPKTGLVVCKVLLFHGFHKHLYVLAYCTSPKTYWLLHLSFLWQEIVIFEIWRNACHRWQLVWTGVFNWCHHGQLY